MRDMREDVFAQVFELGSIQSVQLVIINANARIAYTCLDSSTGVIHTKRGAVKEYRIETALRFLRHLGVNDVHVDMTGWEPYQDLLPLS